MKTLYTRAHRIPPPPFPVVAVDTETTRFDPGRMMRKTRVSPFVPGKLVLGSMTGRGGTDVLAAEDLVYAVNELLKDRCDLVFHNAAYDVPVLLEAGCRKDLFVRAYEENRIHDTKVLEVLCRIAKGVDQHDMHRNTDLQSLARRYAGMELSKTEDVRLGFQIGVTPDEESLAYAAQDAEATYAIFGPLIQKARQLADRPARGKAIEGAQDRFGPLCERNHTMGDLAIIWLQTHPVRVDLEKLRAAEKSLTSRMEVFVDFLTTCTTKVKVVRKRKAGPVEVEVDMPWAKRGTSKGTPTVKLSHKALRIELNQYALDHDIVPEYTSNGDISIERDFWAEYIPRFDPAVHWPAARAGDREAWLVLWQAYARLRLMETRYIDPLVMAERHYPKYYSIGARTTRTSANKFPIQQVPKRRDSLRGVFIPEDGRVFIEADYAAAELTALAQTYLNCYGFSVLADAINAGEDPHLAMAAKVFTDFEGADESRRKELRQACKAVNFGLPGGMGARKFSKFAAGYGVYLSLDEARDLRRAALRADPELGKWLHDHPAQRVQLAARNLALTSHQLAECLNANSKKGPIWHLVYDRLRKWAKDENYRRDHPIPRPPGFDIEFDLWREVSVEPTGTMRGGCFYTDSHNFPFQGGIASVGKLALFRLWSQWTPEDVWRPVAFVHDSILVQTLDDPDQIEYAQELLKSAMLSAIRECCPDVRGGVDVSEPMRTWGKLGGVYTE